MSTTPEPMTTKSLAAALARVRDNDVVARVGGTFVPVVGLRYESLADLYVLDLDPERVADAALSDPVVGELDAAMHSVWLHGDWFWLTRWMTTGQREAAADAVHRHEATAEEADAPGDAGISDRGLRWWAPEYRYNAHGVDTWRIAGGARVEAERPDCGRWNGEVRRRGAQTVQLSHCHRSACTRTATFTFDQIVRVLASPVDSTLARLDAAPDTTKEA